MIRFGLGSLRFTLIFILPGGNDLFGSKPPALPIRFYEGILGFGKVLAYEGYYKPGG